MGRIFYLLRTWFVCFSIAVIWKIHTITFTTTPTVWPIEVYRNFFPITIRSVCVLVVSVGVRACACLLELTSGIVSNHTHTRNSCVIRTVVYCRSHNCAAFFTVSFSLSLIYFVRIRSIRVILFSFLCVCVYFILLIAPSIVYASDTSWSFFAAHIVVGWM